MQEEIEIGHYSRTKNFSFQFFCCAEILSAAHLIIGQSLLQLRSSSTASPQTYKWALYSVIAVMTTLLS